MNKIVQFLAIAFGLAVIVLLAAVVILALTFDPNDYKDEISALVKSETGRELTIQDDLNLSIFPWIGVESGVVIFGNAAGFGPDPFARIDAAKLSIKLLPLFKNQIEIDTVKLYGLSVSLTTNPQGGSNWDDLIAKDIPSVPAPPGAQAPAQAPQTSDQALSLLAGLSVGGLDIRDAQLKWQDQQANTGLILDKININSGPVKLNKPVTFELSLEMQNKQPAVSGTLTMATTLNIDIEQQRFKAKDSRFETRLSGGVVPGGGIDVSLKAADIAADMAQQVLDISSLTFQGLGISLSGELHGKQLIDNPAFQGALKLAEFNPRTVLQQLAVDIPATSDPKVLTKAALDLQIDASMDHLNVKQISGRLDDTTLNGNVSIKSLTAPAIAFKLEIDALDLDRYLPPTMEATAATPATAATAGAIELPLETLRALNLDGTVRLNKLKVSNLTTTGIELTTSAHDGLIKLHPISANLYGGSYKGHIELNAQGNEPAFSFDEQLSALQTGPFLQDLMATDFVSGTANAAIKITTHGKSIDDLRKTLNGSMTFSAVDGRVDGLNLLGSIQQDYAKFANTLVSDAEKLNQTVFSKFAGTVTLKNGLAGTQDLLLVSSQLDAVTRGTADLVTEKLNLTLEITAKKELAKLLKILGGRPIPYYITGTFSEPQFKNGLTDLLKRLGQEAIDKEKAKLEAELKAKQEELKRQAAEEQVKLQKELEAKRKQKEEELKKKAEEEVKDKLKDMFKF